MDEMQENNEKANAQIFILLQGFSLVTMLIGIFGVFNNIVVSLSTRKRFLAVFHESETDGQGCSYRGPGGGLIAGFTGCLCGLLYLVQTNSLMFLLNLPIAVQYPWIIF